MNPNYNANMFLKPDDLNKVENKIEEITKKVQEIVYETESPLVNVKVGDDLYKGKKLYLSFPADAYKYIPKDSTDIVKLIDCGDYYIGYEYYNNGDNSRYYIRFGSIFGYSVACYSKSDDYELNPTRNFIEYTLPYDFGKVKVINTNSELYKYIKIYENDENMPDYDKKEWVDNEIPYIQEIDRIEKGVRNIGDFYNKSLDWITTKEWISENGLDIKPFSYQDINRWITDLNTIDLDEIENDTIWNTNKSTYYWL